MYSQAFRIVVIEDQPLIRKDVVKLLEEQPGIVVVGSCGSIREAKILIPASEPDLVILDISLADGNGFDLLEKMSPYDFKVIFLTAHPEHAMKAIKFGALDYLVKPLDQTELEVALQKAMAGKPTLPAMQPLYVQEASKRIVLRSQDYWQIVELNLVMYCQSDGGYTTFHLSDGKKVLTSKYLKEYEGFLPATLFIRTHQSYVVNLSYIEKFLKDGILVLKNGEEIPVSVRRRETVLMALTGK